MPVLAELERLTVFLQAAIPGNIIICYAINYTGRNVVVFEYKFIG